MGGTMFKNNRIFIYLFVFVLLLSVSLGVRHWVKVDEPQELKIKNLKYDLFEEQRQPLCVRSSDSSIKKLFILAVKEPGSDTFEHQQLDADFIFKSDEEIEKYLQDQQLNYEQGTIIKLLVEIKL